MNEYTKAYLEQIRKDKKCGKSGIPENAKCTKTTSGAKSKGVKVRRGPVIGKREVGTGTVVGVVGFTALAAAAIANRPGAEERQPQVLHMPQGEGNAKAERSAIAKNLKPEAVVMANQAVDNERKRLAAAKRANQNKQTVNNIRQQIESILRGKAVKEQQENKSPSNPLPGLPGGANFLPPERGLSLPETDSGIIFFPEEKARFSGDITDAQIGSLPSANDFRKAEYIELRKNGGHSPVYSTNIAGNNYFVKKLSTIGAGFESMGQGETSAQGSAEEFAGLAAKRFGLERFVPDVKRFEMDGDEYVAQRLENGLEYSGKPSGSAVMTGFNRLKDGLVTPNEAEELYEFTFLMGDQDRTVSNVFTRPGKPILVTDFGMAGKVAFPRDKDMLGRPTNTFFNEVKDRPVNSDRIRSYRNRLGELDRDIDSAYRQFNPEFRNLMKRNLRERLSVLEEATFDKSTYAEVARIGQRRRDFSMPSSEEVGSSDQPSVDDLMRQLERAMNNMAPDTDRRSDSPAYAEGFESVRLDKKCGNSGIPDTAKCTKGQGGATSKKKGRPRVSNSRRPLNPKAAAAALTTGAAIAASAAAMALIEKRAKRFSGLSAQMHPKFNPRVAGAIEAASCKRDADTCSPDLSDMATETAGQISQGKTLEGIERVTGGSAGDLLVDRANNVAYKKFKRGSSQDVDREMEVGYVAGELGVGPKVLGKEGHVIAQEYLGDYKEGSNRPLGLQQEMPKVLEALDVFHRAGYAHGDLRPDNWMSHRNEKGELDDLKLIDFSSSQKQEDDFLEGIKLDYIMTGKLMEKAGLATEDEMRDITFGMFQVDDIPSMPEKLEAVSALNKQMQKLAKRGSRKDSVRQDKKCGKSGIPDNAKCTKGQGRAKSKSRGSGANPGKVIGQVVQKAGKVLISQEAGTALLAASVGIAGAAAIRDHVKFANRVTEAEEARRKTEEFRRKQEERFRRREERAAAAKATPEQKEQLKTPPPKSERKPQSPGLGPQEEDGRLDFPLSLVKRQPAPDLDIEGMPSAKQFQDADYVEFVNEDGSPKHSPLFSTTIDGSTYFVKKVSPVSEDQPKEEYMSEANAEEFAGLAAKRMGVADMVPPAKQFEGKDGELYVAQPMQKDLELVHRTSGPVNRLKKNSFPERDIAKAYDFTFIMGDQDRSVSNTFSQNGQLKILDHGFTNKAHHPVEYVVNAEDVTRNTLYYEISDRKVDPNTVARYEQVLPGIEEDIDKAYRHYSDDFRLHIKQGWRIRLAMMRETADEGGTYADLQEKQASERSRLVVARMIERMKNLRRDGFRLDKKCGKSGIPDNAKCSKSTTGTTAPETIKSAAEKLAADPRFKKTLQGVGEEVASAAVAGALVASVPLAGYMAARTNYRNGFKKSADIANKRADELEKDVPDDLKTGVDFSSKKSGGFANQEDFQGTDEPEQVTFVVGGFAGPEEQNSADVWAERLWSKDDKFRNQHFKPLSNEKFNVSVNLNSPADKKVGSFFGEVLKGPLKDGRNEQAVEMAAQAIAYHRKHPNKPINLIGYSAGGMVTHEVQEILHEAGIETRVANMGSPYFGLTEKKGPSVTFASKRDVLTETYPVRDRVDVNTVRDHFTYVSNRRVRNKLKNFFETGSTEPRKDAISFSPARVRSAGLQTDMVLA